MLSGMMQIGMAVGGVGVLTIAAGFGGRNGDVRLIGGVIILIGAMIGCT